MESFKRGFEIGVNEENQQVLRESNQESIYPWTTMAPKRSKILNRIGYKKGKDSTLGPPRLLPKWVPTGNIEGIHNHVVMNSAPDSIVDHEIRLECRVMAIVLEARLLPWTIGLPILCSLINVLGCFLEL